MSGLVSVDEALSLLDTHGFAPRAEEIPIAEADGAVLAEDVVALVSRPPLPVSAMDGYAVRLEDVREAGRSLRVIGEAPAGLPFAGQVGPGQAVRIFTGGVLPGGSDHIIIQEEARRDGEIVTFESGHDQVRHVRAAGLDFKHGDHLLRAGTSLGAAELALVAAANHATVKVRRRLRVGLLANGNELKAPGSTLAPGEIINSNPVALSVLVRRWGGLPVDLGIADDSEADIRHHIAQADGIDLFLPIGGASVGNHDHMRGAFASEGFEAVFEKIAVKPGKPSWFSRRGHQRVMGLPGNPASALVCAYLFAQPLITQRKGHETRPAALTRDLPENGPREAFLRAGVHLGPDGRLNVTPAANQDSSLISPFRSANGLLRRRSGAKPVRAGTPVEVMLIGPL